MLLPERTKWESDFIVSEKMQSIMSAANSITEYDRWLTPRTEHLYKGEISLQPFYILEYITSNSNDTIYDIGCGYNFFKKFYPIIGIDPNCCQADITGQFDTEYARKFKRKLPNAFTINAIHFCDMARLPSAIYEFIELVRPGGYVYIAINFARVIEKTIRNFKKLKPAFLKSNIPNKELTLEIIESYENKTPNFDKVIEFMNSIVDKIHDNIIQYENCIKDFPDEAGDGNFRILIKRKQ